MKTKILFVALFIINGLFAQDISKNAIGLRLGSNNGFGTEISYQRALGESNRLEADLGWQSGDNVNAFKLTGIYQWTWNIDKGFYWYAGVGGGIGSWSYSYAGSKNSGTFLYAAGDVGVEYNFDIPVQVSLDFRPELYFASSGYRDNNFGSNIGLSVRYKFD